MNLFIELHQKLLNTLLKHYVEFIIIGGYSVIYHGYKRTTGDVDIWLKPDNENKTKLISALKIFDIEVEGLEWIEQQDFTNMHAFHIWEEPEKVDFITKINLVSYEEADSQKIVAKVDNMEIPFMHLNHLVLSKINTGRLKDAADVEELQKISNLINKK